MGSLGAVDRLILDEAGPLSGRVLVLDSPGIANELARAGMTKLKVYCDDVIAEQECVTPVLATLEKVLKPGKKASPTTVLMRLPKSLGQLEEYTQILSALPEVRVVAGGRVKHMTPAMNTVLASGFERVYASLGRNKSRVLHAQGGRGTLRQIWPKTAFHEKLGLQVVAHGGVFSGVRLDRGTRLLLDNLNPEVFGRRAIDLGCGSGVLSAVLAGGGSQVIAVDVSRAACRSTAATAASNGVSERIQVVRNDGLRGFEAESSEVILCNPPFHVGTTKDSAPAERMFRGAGRVLVPGGEMWTVFNSHLPYRDLLRHLVGPTKIIAQNPSYTVTRSVRKS